MTRVILAMAVLLLVCCGQARASIAVAPVIIEADQVQAGQVFTVVCSHGGEEPLEVALSLALFDQDAWGRVILMEDEASVARAEEALSLERRRFLLQPGQSEAVQVQLAHADFQHLYAVLFLRPVRPGPSTRLAVLFLLSSGEGTPSLDLSGWEQRGTDLTITVENSGLCHGFWAGELLLFDGEGKLAEKVSVQSGVVLPGRSRGLQVSLPGWVQQVEVRSLQLGDGS